MFIRNPCIVACLIAIVFLAGSSASGNHLSGNWPQFRGAGASGVSAGPATPTEWDVTSGKNVKWKAPVPGLGYSCPVIWGDRLFVTTAVKEGEEQKVRVGLYGDKIGRASCRERGEGCD